jgi:hypothetical protein
MRGWLYEGHHEFRLGYSCESEVVKVYKDIADLLDKEVRIDAIVDFSKVFDLFPRDRLLAKIEANGLDLKVVVWVKDFLL